MRDNVTGDPFSKVSFRIANVSNSVLELMKVYLLPSAILNLLSELFPLLNTFDVSMYFVLVSHG